MTKVTRIRHNVVILPLYRGFLWNIVLILCGPAVLKECPRVAVARHNDLRFCQETLILTALV
jgi:hypothetical protein